MDKREYLAYAGESVYIAHKTEDGRIESVEDHCNKVASLASLYASAFTDSSQGRLVGLYHDLGKYSKAFQRRIRGSSEHVDHSSIGAFLCWSKNHIPAAFSIMGHHSGLPDLGSRIDTIDDPTFFGRIKKVQKFDLSEYPESIIGDNDAVEENFTSPAKFMDYTRMLFSCLVDADYLATESFFSGKTRVIERADFRILESRLIDFVSPWFPPSNCVNKARCAILKRCFEFGQNTEPGLFELTVPTGAGKTISSLAFAIEHALSNGMDRIIYVIPYTSIVEQTAGIFRSILGEDVVLEHHSTYEPEYSENSRSFYAIENWDIPIIVTTSVQFFESLYSSKPSRCRKIHNIVNSVVVFDEVQMLPLDYLMPCVHAISSLVDDFKVSAILCTATQPALRPFFSEYSKDCLILDICPSSLYDPSVFARVRYEYIGQGIMDQDIAKQMMGYDQVLCIVNTREAACTIYRNLEGSGNYHLSTLMYPEHRKAVIQKIKDRLKKGMVCRVVSTSLIEAGVDVDFHTVYRELSGFDSLVQAGGRCNREGRYPKSECVVRVFRSNRRIPDLLRIPASCAEEVVRELQFNDMERSVSMFFQKMYDIRGKESLDKKGIIDDLKGGQFPFRIVDDKFRFIESNTKEVLIPTEESEYLLDLVLSGKADRNTYRKMHKYSVPLYENQFNRLYENGKIRIYENFLCRLEDSGLYDECTGLKLMENEADAIFI